MVATLANLNFKQLDNLCIKKFGAPKKYRRKEIRKLHQKLGKFRTSDKKQKDNFRIEIND